MTKTTEMLFTECPICGSKEDYKVIYKSNLDNVVIDSNIFSARRLPDAVHYQIVRCKNDGLVRSNPVFKIDGIEKLYKESKFTYFDQVKDLTVTYLNALNEVLPFLSRDDEILEIGCGNGFLLQALLQKGFNNCYGIEPSLDAISKASEEVRRKINAGFLKEGTYKKGEFKLIYCFQTLDHIYDPADFLKMCFNLLSPGGFMLVFNHDVESLSSKIMRSKSPIIDIEHPFLYSKKTGRKLFVKFNFKVVKVYSPRNVISLGYLIWLLPLPKRIKVKLLGLKGILWDFILKQKIILPLGNLCIIVAKPVNDPI